MQSKLTHWDPLYPSVNILVRDPVLYLTQDGGQSFEWNYSKCDIPFSVSDKGVMQIVLCAYNYVFLMLYSIKFHIS